MTAPQIQRRVVGITAEQLRLKATAVLNAGFTTNPFKGVEWSPSFIAFCVYVFVIISNRVPIGTASMAIALLTVPMEKTQLRFPAVASFTAALVLWALVGITTTEYPDTVIDSVTEFTKVLAVVVVAVNVLTTRARLRAFIVGAIIVFCAYPVRGTLFNYFIYKGYNEDGRAAWNFIYSNPNDLAGLCILVLAVALGALAIEQRYWVKWGLRAAVALIVLTIVLTASRGALIALVAFGIIYGRKYVRNVKKVLMGVALVVGIVLVTPDTAWRRFSTIATATQENADLLDPDVVGQQTQSDQSSSEQRLAIWTVARAIIAENPISGVGLGTYPEAHLKMALIGPPRFKDTARGRRDTHSTYLKSMAEVGAIGFTIFMAIIVITLVNSHRTRKRVEAKAPALALQLFNMEVGLYGFLVAAIWGSYGGFILLYIHLAIMYACTRLVEEDLNGSGVPLGRRRIGQPLAGAAIPYARARS